MQCSCHCPQIWTVYSERCLLQFKGLYASICRWVYEHIYVVHAANVIELHLKLNLHTAVLGTCTEFILSWTHTENMREGEQGCKNITGRLLAVYDHQQAKEVCDHVSEQNHYIVVIADPMWFLFLSNRTTVCVTLPSRDSSPLHRKGPDQKWNNL